MPTQPTERQAPAGLPPAHLWRSAIRLSPVDWLRSADPRVLDVVTTLLATALTLLAVLDNYRTGLLVSYGWSVSAAVLCSSTLLFRRRLPELIAVSSLVSTLATDDSTLLVFGSWTVARYAKQRRGALLALIALGYVITRPLVADPLLSYQAIYHLGVDVILPAIVGSTLRRQELFNRLVRQQVHRVQKSVDQAAKYAVLEERTRLAFDMHDGVGHQVAVVTLQAQAINVNAEHPEKVREGAKVVEDASREVMSELRAILDMLRSNPGDNTPPMRLSQTDYHTFLNSLVRNMNAVGVNAQCTVLGTPVPLPRETQTMLYRIGQEGLTNAVKYAPGAAILIRLAFHPYRVDIAIENRRPTDKNPSLGSGGVGLEGLTARVREHGGYLQATPTRNGGFLLQAHLPINTADAVQRR
ncbi:sensor histidine kinase [Streptomyces sp. N35]|uniref:sensor histidine kinase n=1 Tax=Streptomyces sp. N35 TaxID=2795730 RepID=UPI0018F56DE9|nr:histidine kinase [Streptomyces sp. N35]